MYRFILLLSFFSVPVYAQSVIPNFNQGVLTQRSETKSTTVEDIKSFDIRNGYQLTIGGENVKSSTGNVAPTGWTKLDTTVQGVGTTYVSPNLDNKPTFSIVNEGQSFQYFETLETPGITNYTHIQRTTQIENVTDTLSTFSQ
jgi:hypothetical protein|tara:strand:+ start:147 stop:575 length:429 start_codon:yes stop_codon:yes gene_type:complete